MFRGKPMICYPIETAQASKLFDLIVVSTDDDEIEDVALKMNAIVTRRPTDDGTKGTQQIAADVLKNIHAHFACVIYPCSPLLGPEQLMDGMRALQFSTYAMSVDSLGRDAGCFYWGRGDAFLKGIPLDGSHTAKVILPAGRCCDINTPADLSRAESLYDALRRAP